VPDEFRPYGAPGGNERIANEQETGAHALMIQGTGSNVGKSLIVAGLCRLFANRGMTVRPFKPQNMSNNAAVTADGGEIGRAQALQAMGCRVPLTVHMNPVLLKPETDTGAQVIVQGKRFGTMRAREYGKQKAELLPKVLESFSKCDQARIWSSSKARAVRPKST
jgi:adenosylcobyric acid synthase